MWRQSIEEERSTQWRAANSERDKCDVGQCAKTSPELHEKINDLFSLTPIEPLESKTS